MKKTKSVKSRKENANSPKTITMTEKQLETIITNSIKNAITELKRDEETKDSIKASPATSILLFIVSYFILSILIVFSVAVIAASIQLMINKPQYLNSSVMFLIIALLVLIISVSLCIEIYKTKKIEVLNTIFSAIMAVSTLTVAVVSAYFAYRSIGVV